MGLMRVEKSIISFSRRNGCFASTIWSKSSCSVERSMREVFSDGFCIKYVGTRATMEIFYHISLYYFLWRSRSFGNSPHMVASHRKLPVRLIIVRKVQSPRLRLAFHFPHDGLVFPIRNDRDPHLPVSFENA